MKGFQSDQTRADLAASLHSAEYNALISALPAGSRDRFLCLKPICGSDNIEEESRKQLVLASVINQIGVAVSSGESMETAVDRVPDYCGCSLPPCSCSDPVVTSGS